MVQDSIKSGLDELRDKVAQIMLVTRGSSSAKDRFESSQRQVGCQIILKHQQHFFLIAGTFSMFEGFVKLKPVRVLFLSEEDD